MRVFRRLGLRCLFIVPPMGVPLLTACGGGLQGEATPDRRGSPDAADGSDDASGSGGGETSGGSDGGGAADGGSGIAADEMPPMRYHIVAHQFEPNNGKQQNQNNSC